MCSNVNAKFMHLFANSLIPQGDYQMLVTFGDRRIILVSVYSLWNQLFSDTKHDTIIPSETGATLEVVNFLG